MVNKVLVALAAVAVSAALPAAAEAKKGGRHWHHGAYGDRFYGPRYYGPRAYAGRYYGDRYYGRRYGSRYYGDRYYGRPYGYDGGRYYRRRCRSGLTGAIVGGAAGALLGREVTRGRDRYGYRRGSGTTGAIVGGAVGALVGKELTDNC